MTTAAQFVDCPAGHANERKENQKIHERVKDIAKIQKIKNVMPNKGWASPWEIIF